MKTYRLLREGERVKEGDEYFDDHNWVTVSEYDINVLMSEDLKPHRREYYAGKTSDECNAIEEAQEEIERLKGGI